MECIHEHGIPPTPKCGVSGCVERAFTHILRLGWRCRDHTPLPEEKVLHKDEAVIIVWVKDHVEHRYGGGGL